MRVTIVGAGVVGVTTAYFVAQRGHDVTLLERHSRPAEDTSFANAGQLSYSYTDTLADPGMLRRLPSLLLGRDIGMRIRIDAALIPWGLRFLWQCTRAKADRNTVELLRLAADSAQTLDRLLADVALNFDHRPAGKLMVTASTQTLAGLRRRAALKSEHGARIDVIGPAECKAIEPALEGWCGEIAGASYSESDQVGDTRRFTQGLFDHLQTRRLCDIRINVMATGLRLRGRRVTGIETAAGSIEADAVIVCAGMGTRRLLRGTGIRVPIYPLKGYSVTQPPGSRPPLVSVTDLDRRIVFANLGGRIRLAGLADCAGIDTSIDPRRIADLIALGRDVMPEAARYDEPLEPWAGLRPATPSSLPIVGGTHLHGLYLNVGHGALGWTLACGAASKLAATF